MSLLLLPDELQVSILTLAGLDDVTTLASVASTCQHFRDMINHNHDIWLQLHLILYDDPRLACAFPSPRTSFDWRRRVIHRKQAETFLASHSVPPREPLRHYHGFLVEPYRDPPISSPGRPCPIKSNAPWILRTALELYLDLPAYPHPSRNVTALQTMIASDVFAYMFIVGPSDDTVSHLEALLFHVKQFSEHSNPWGSFATYHRDWRSNLAEYASLEGEQPLPDRTYWRGVAIDIAFAADQLLGTEWQYHEVLDLSTVHLLLSDGIDAIRGQGILGLQRPASLAPSDVWDWANVEAEWHVVQSRGGLTTSGNLRDPVHFEDHACKLIPVHDISAVVDVYMSRPGNSEIGRRLLYEFPAFLSPDLSEDSPLPRLYFYNRPSRPTNVFLCGVVYLTNDSPPEVRWDMAIVGRSTSNSYMFRGVQLGGNGARRGIIGDYKVWPNDPLPRKLVLGAKKRRLSKREIDFSEDTEGMIWLFKAWVSRFVLG